MSGVKTFKTKARVLKRNDYIEAFELLDSILFPSKFF